MSNQAYKQFEHGDYEEEGVTTDMHFATPPSVAYSHVSRYAGSARACWGRRTCLERVLCVLLGVCVLVMIVLAALLGSKSKQVTAMRKQEKCVDASCVNLASTMLRAMDQTVDPCVDFYEYACAGWRRHNLIPPGSSAWGTFDDLVLNNERVIKLVLENTTDEVSSEAVKKARRYYKSCMDKQGIIENLGAQPLYDMLEDVAGWNISAINGATWSAEDFDLQDTMQKVLVYGISPFYSLYVTQDDKNVSVNIIQIDQGGITLPRDEYLNKTTDDKVLGAYLRYMVDLGVLMGGEKQSTERQMRDVIDFETQLAELHTPSDERRDAEMHYNKKTLADVQQMAPFMDWSSVLNAQFTVTNITIDDTESILLYEPRYLQDMSILVTNKSATTQGKTTLQNYLLWHLIRMYAPALSSEFREVAKRFSRTIQGIEGDEEHWKHCVDDTSSTFAFAIGSMYVNAEFHGESKATAEEMISGVKRAFKKNLATLPWMDPVTQQASEEKVDAVTDMIGYPDFITNSTALDERYEGLEIKEDEYFENNVREIQYSLRIGLEKLRKPPDKKSWGMAPQEVNAYYSPGVNEIVFPAGILQPPFFDQHFPTSVNYGGMGVVMGHELTHGFDDEGLLCRKCNKNFSGNK